MIDNYFRDQSLLDHDNIEVHPTLLYALSSERNVIILIFDEIKFVLKSHSVGKVIGPVGISNRILKELADEIANPLISLFNQSLINKTAPKDWKKAHITPVPKIDDPSSPSIYRTISLLSNITKVFGRCIF